MTFQIQALDPAEFTAFHSLSDAELAEQGARRVIADDDVGFPCRVSLADAAKGDRLILVNYRHLDVHSPYAASHAVYVREGVAQVHPAPGEIPEMIARRLLSVRGFDAEGYIEQAEIVQGEALSDTLDKMFAQPSIVHVDIHIAQPGCFAARAHRA